MKNVLLSIIISAFSVSSFSQEIINNKINDQNIKTVLMYSGNNDLSMPIWDLGSARQLTLSFDHLSLDIQDYYYTIIHCNSNWEPSNLDQSEYIDGYFEDQISEYQSSFNTNVNYTHYKLKFPSEYMRPTVSGNYILQVYDNYNPDKILFTKRFMVVERKTNIAARVRNMNQTSNYSNDQELEVVVDYTEDEFYDIIGNLKVQVLKNRNWTSYLELTQPNLIKDYEFTFNDFTKLKFEGGNEFHVFNSKNIHHYSENIQNISFIDNMYHFQLVEDVDRTFADYVYKQELNGQFKVDVNPSEYPETEADYVFAYFTLKMNAPMQEGDIYVWGGLTNYDFTEDSKMTYNFEQKAYECRLFLKQGYYTYQYVLFEKGEYDFKYIEGNHSQTENSYTVLVYYHDFRGDYDRLIGVSEVSSRIK
jgi:hypothetical protein